MGTWQSCWDLFALTILLSGNVLVLPSQTSCRRSWENHAAFSCEEKCYCQVFPMSKIMYIVIFPCVVGQVKYLRFTGQHWCDLPGNVCVLLQFLKPGWVTIGYLMFSGPRAEDRNICLGAEISKDPLTLRIHLIEKRQPTINSKIKKPWGSTPCEGQKI